ncbi:uncharacterized protein ASCRUDRAFT_70786 [Ascoidea rubescens DSM 1968]|uniref:Inner centromere protein ARK-binding domain-containing protein n=1 Tax=Ascoidea rubescens DSM 1968 TaxID=1344418 RepID=A0A1D2VFJ8_9ASCO|nr:hypothetical protein ASCRUDRAFT_70786 [Ascoidea rubescens DSM 1968]ODV60247.1 hypothetical protein ASCRUDRAFT_70786 [Ascoidea rubescens DSM 1968]
MNEFWVLNLTKNKNNSTLIPGSSKWIASQLSQMNSDAQSLAETFLNSVNSNINWLNNQMLEILSNKEYDENQLQIPKSQNISDNDLSISINPSSSFSIDNYTSVIDISDDEDQDQLQINYQNFNHYQTRNKTQNLNQTHQEFHDIKNSDVDIDFDLTLDLDDQTIINTTRNIINQFSSPFYSQNFHTHNIQNTRNISKNNNTEDQIQNKNENRTDNKIKSVKFKNNSNQSIINHSNHSQHSSISSPLNISISDISQSFSMVSSKRVIHSSPSKININNQTSNEINDKINEEITDKITDKINHEINHGINNQSDNKSDKKLDNTNHNHIIENAKNFIQKIDNNNNEINNKIDNKIDNRIENSLNKENYFENQTKIVEKNQNSIRNQIEKQKKIEIEIENNNKIDNKIDKIDSEIDFQREHVIELENQRENENVRKIPYKFAPLPTRLPLKRLSSPSRKRNKKFHVNKTFTNITTLDSNIPSSFQVFRDKPDFKLSKSAGDISSNHNLLNQSSKISLIDISKRFENQKSMPRIELQNQKKRNSITERINDIQMDNIKHRETMPLQDNQNDISKSEHKNIPSFSRSQLREKSILADHSSNKSTNINPGNKRVNGQQASLVSTNKKVEKNLPSPKNSDIEPNRNSIQPKQNEFLGNVNEEIVLILKQETNKNHPIDLEKTHNKNTFEETEKAKEKICFSNNSQISKLNHKLEDNFQKFENHKILRTSPKNELFTNPNLLNLKNKMPKFSEINNKKDEPIIESEKRLTNEKLVPLLDRAALQLENNKKDEMDIIQNKNFEYIQELQRKQETIKTILNIDSNLELEKNNKTDFLEKRDEKNKNQKNEANYVLQKKEELERIKKLAKERIEKLEVEKEKIQKEEVRKLMGEKKLFEDIKKRMIEQQKTEEIKQQKIEELKQQKLKLEKEKLKLEKLRLEKLKKEKLTRSNNTTSERKIDHKSSNRFLFKNLLSSSHNTKILADIDHSNITSSNRQAMMQENEKIVKPTLIDSNRKSSLDKNLVGHSKIESNSNKADLISRLLVPTKSSTAKALNNYSNYLSFTESPLLAKTTRSSKLKSLSPLKKKSFIEMNNIKPKLSLLSNKNQERQPSFLLKKFERSSLNPTIFENTNHENKLEIKQARQTFNKELMARKRDFPNESVSKALNDVLEVNKKQKTNDTFHSNILFGKQSDKRVSKIMLLPFQPSSHALSDLNQDPQTVSLNATQKSKVQSNLQKSNPFAKIPSLKKTPVTPRFISLIQNQREKPFSPTVLPDINSESEDDHNGNVLKNWANSPELKQLLLRQQQMDPEKLFGPIQPLRMDEIFQGSRASRFKGRSSSGRWLAKDNASTQETHSYKKQMGYK